MIKIKLLILHKNVAEDKTVQQLTMYSHLPFLELFGL